MDSRIRQILDQIKVLEDELQTAIKEHESRLHYTIEGTRVTFENAIKDAHLHIIEKVHCMYCSYAVGLLSYGREITARTEQYFCPIKHAKKGYGIHSRYESFLDYGNADDYHSKLEEFRNKLARETDQIDKP